MDQEREGEVHQGEPTLQQDETDPEPTRSAGPLDQHAHGELQLLVVARERLWRNGYPRVLNQAEGGRSPEETTSQTPESGDAGILEGAD